MEIIHITSLTLLLLVLGSCKKEEITNEQSYVFLKPYCATVVVGGVVGLAEKCFEIGDIVIGEKSIDGKVRIRIAEHGLLNEGHPNSANYQELLDVPSDYLEVLKN